MYFHSPPLSLSILNPPLPPFSYFRIKHKGKNKPPLKNMVFLKRHKSLTRHVYKRKVESKRERVQEDGERDCRRKKTPPLSISKRRFEHALSVLPQCDNRASCAFCHCRDLETLLLCYKLHAYNNAV